MIYNHFQPAPVPRARGDDILRQSFVPIPTERKGLRIADRHEKTQKLIIKAVPYVAFSYVGNLIGFAYRTAEGNGFQEKLLPFMSNLGVAFARIFPSLHPFDLLIGLGLAGVMRLVLYVKSKNRKKFRQGEEYGSAVWGGERILSRMWTYPVPKTM